MRISSLVEQNFSVLFYISNDDNRSNEYYDHSNSDNGGGSSDEDAFDNDDGDDNGCIYSTPSPWIGCETRSVFKQRTTGLNSEFYF